MRTSQDMQRCTLVDVTRLAALIAVCATIPALGRLIWLMVQSGDRKAATYATGGLIDKQPVFNVWPTELVGLKLDPPSGITVNVSGTVADPDALVAALRRHLGMDRGDDGDGGMPYGGYPK